MTTSSNRASHLTAWLLVLALTFVGQILSGLVGSCSAGLLAATVPERSRAAAAGWMSTGNLGGGALGAWLTVALGDSRRCPAWGVALALAACMVLPALAALFVDEERQPRERIAVVFAGLWSDVSRTLRAQRGWACLLFCL